MPVLALDYRCCARHLPRYLKHAEVEGIAQLVRQQLVGSNVDAISLSVLGTVSALKVNGIHFDLWVDTEHPVADEHGHPVLGVCEFDPGASPDAAILSVSPASENATEELVLSTFAHELGHAIFDAPGWVVAASKGPGMFDDPNEFARKAYRTTTRDSEHLNGATPVVDHEPAHTRFTHSQTEKDIRFAELRANEFMGSLLVPRARLICAVEELAPGFDIPIHHSPSLVDDIPAGTPCLAVDDDVDFFDLERLQKSIARRFGVHRRFIEVRMERYGLLPSDRRSF